MSCCKCCCEAAGGVCCGETCCYDHCCGGTCQSTPCCDLVPCQLVAPLCPVCEETSPGVFECVENYANYVCNGSATTWSYDFDTCGTGYVAPGSGECGACDSDPMTNQACVVCCIPNPAP